MNQIVLQTHDGKNLSLKRWNYIWAFYFETKINDPNVTIDGGQHQQRTACLVVKVEEGWH